MYVSKRILGIAVGFVLVSAAIALLALLYIELNQANADLRETKVELQQTAANLEETTGTLAASNQVNANLTRENASLQRVKEEQDDALVAYEEQRKQLDGELAATRQSLAQSHAEIEKGNADIEKGNTEIRRLDSELAKANTTINELSVSRQTLQRSYNELVAARGAIDTLKAEETWLRNEITRLEAMRRPLILGRGTIERAGFRCTGSMEPKITCLDEATWLTDFDPADISVGATIAYAPACWGDPDGVAHRVVDVAIRGGTHYFWTKGDNNPEADGCWVPEHDVEGYIIEIHKNVAMENAYLREQVNNAREAFLNAAALYAKRYETYCGSADPNTCSTWLYRSQMNELAQLWDLRKRAYDHYNCWYTNAEEMEYDGHIPYSC